MRRALCATLFLSGTAALLFENLWFRGAHLALGNGVWAQSVVLAAFMAGLATGSALAARPGRFATHPLRAYARLEILVAAVGLVLLVVLPKASSWLAPWLAPLTGRPVLLNAARLGAAFLMLVVPTTAMGMTLPLAVRALSRQGTFGDNLGALYGWNTLGAVAGALGVEAVLVPSLGIRGSGALASALGLSAAFVASLVARGVAVGSEALSEPKVETPGAGPDGSAMLPLGGEAKRLLAVAGLAGAVLLALEVVWFRFLALYTDGTALSFAVLLAVVLLGIGSGGLAASAWLRRAQAAPYLGGLVGGSAVLVVVQYAGFYRCLPLLLDPSRPPMLRALVAAAWLTLPSCFLSGLLFTMLGSALERHVASPQSAAGLLVLFNTTGALAGALLGGFVLLPGLGMERSFFTLALVYSAAWLVLPAAARLPSGGPGRLLAVGILSLALGSVALFPFGVMDRLYVRAPLVRFGEATILDVREGLTETAVLMEHRFRGRHHSLRLVTNGFSMTADSWAARRYMGLFADLPLALHERPRSALLICYGLGVTARALTQTPELERIDVVDLAPEVVSLAEAGSRFGPNPLRDPRVKVHVEDGRAFLALTRERYDLVTAEPPPPTNAGIASLYTREHFELVRSRLAEGGFVSYWLPVHTLDDTAAPAVISAFCAVFSDCSLWSGSDLDWVLVGTRGRRQPVTAARVLERWDDGVRGAALRDAGIERPEQMAALYLADAARLRRLAAGVPALEDDRPSRIGRASATLPTAFAYRVLFGEDLGHGFASSPEMARLWPAEIREGAGPEFRQQEVQNRLLITRLARRPPEEAWLHLVYQTSTARLPVLLFFGSEPDRQRIAREAESSGEREPWVEWELAVAALAERRPDLTVERLQSGPQPDEPRSAFLLAYALALDGRFAQSRALRSRLDSRSAGFLAETFPAWTAGSGGAGAGRSE